jgi:hypothetical protein
MFCAGALVLVQVNAAERTSRTGVFTAQLHCLLPHVEPHS